MDKFIQKALSVDNTPSDLNSEYSIKRCVQRSLHVFASAIKASIKGYATQKLWCGWSANIKGGCRPTQLLPHAKMLLVPISFFPLLGRLCFERFYIFTEQMWFKLLVSHREVMALISIYCGFCFWSAEFALWCKSIFFDLFWSIKLFITVEWGF